MILTVITVLVLLTYLASFAMPLTMYQRCVVDYCMLAYFGWILWKLIITEEDK